MELVSFSVACASQPSNSFQIHRAFTAKELSLARHTYPVKALQERYCHLKDLPLPSIKEAQLLLLIGSDYTHFITPAEPIRLGPPGGPAAVHTRLGESTRPIEIPAPPANSAAVLFHLLYPSRSRALQPRGETMAAGYPAVSE